MHDCHTKHFFVFDEIDALAATFEAASEKFQERFPAESRLKILKSAIAQDGASSYAYLDYTNFFQEKSRTAARTGHPNEVLDYMALCEMSVRIIDLAGLHDDLVDAHTASDLTHEHVQILQELELPSLARIIEDAIERQQTAPQPPKAKTPKTACPSFSL